MKNRLLILALLFIIRQLSFAQNHSIDFDGADDLITSPVMTDTLNTIEFWVNNDVTIDGIAQLSLPFNFSSATQYISFNNCCSGVTGETITIVNSNTTLSASATNQSLSSGWHHIAFTSNGMNYNKIYINGILANMISTNSPVIYNTKLDLGYRTFVNSYGAFPYNGRFDEIRIWKVARTQFEIQNNMNSELTGNEPNLILYYKMDNTNSSCDIEDCSPHEFHGVRTGINSANNRPQFSSDAPSLNLVPCGASISCINTSIEKFTYQKPEIVVFPNPTNGETTLLFNQNVNNANVRILNVTGQKMFEKINVNGTQLNIDISSQSSGIYIIEVEQLGGTLRKKLIKN